MNDTPPLPEPRADAAMVERVLDTAWFQRSASSPIVLSEIYWIRDAALFGIAARERIRRAHNGYDAESRKSMNIKEPANEMEALEDLLTENDQLASIELRQARERIAELEKILDDTLRNIPVGNLRTHTRESIPDRVNQYVKDSVQLSLVDDTLIDAGLVFGDDENTVDGLRRLIAERDAACAAGKALQRDLDSSQQRIAELEGRVAMLGAVNDALGVERDRAEAERDAAIEAGNRRAVEELEAVSRWSSITCWPDVKNDYDMRCMLRAHLRERLAALRAAPQPPGRVILDHDPTSTGAEEEYVEKMFPQQPPAKPVAGRYSDDRMSLAQEIAETLKARGHWVPKDFAGPDLITAVGKALEPAAVVDEAEIKAWVAEATSAIQPDTQFYRVTSEEIDQAVRLMRRAAPAPADGEGLRAKLEAAEKTAAYWEGVHKENFKVADEARAILGYEPGKVRLQFMAQAAKDQIEKLRAELAAARKQAVDTLHHVDKRLNKNAVEAMWTMDDGMSARSRMVTTGQVHCTIIDAVARLESNPLTAPQQGEDKLDAGKVREWTRPLDDPQDPQGINALRSEIVRCAEMLAKRRHELAVIQRETMRQRGQVFDREIQAILKAGVVLERDGGA